MVMHVCDACAVRTESCAAVHGVLWRQPEVLAKLKIELSALSD